MSATTLDCLSFLTTQGLAADASSFGSMADELQAAATVPVVAPLTDLGLIRAAGPDAADFLHNLLSNDIKGMAATDARFAGFCTPKGRLLACFWIWRDGDDLLLALPADSHAAILKKLSMYLLRSRLKLSDASTEWVLLGMTGLEAAVSPAPTLGTAASLAPRTLCALDGGVALRLDATRWMLALNPANAIAAWPALSSLAHPVGLAAWQWLEIAAGMPRVVAATQEAFVPQMLNMEQAAVGGVSFTKGCYPGQEIVARTQYLGKVKRRLFRARLGAQHAPGTPLFAAQTGDQSCGTLVSVAPSPAGGFEVLVSVQIGAVEAGDVRLRTPDGERIEFLELPYALI